MQQKAINVKFERIHSFKDGNGRMSRLLTTLLLYRAGYVIGKTSVESSIKALVDNGMLVKQGRYKISD